MKLVTCVIVLLGLSPFGSVESAAATDVEDLDSGACWVQQTRGGFWKISSFNDGQAFYLDPTRLSGEFEPALTATLKARGLSRFAGGPYEVHLHCSGGKPEGAPHFLVAHMRYRKVLPSNNACALPKSAAHLLALDLMVNPL